MKKKIYLELGITLIIGFLIGFFVNSNITDRRIKGYSMHQGESQFWKRALEEIDATREQKSLIFPIIKEHSEETRKVIHKAWRELPPIWDRMEDEIMLILTPEQQVQIKDIKDNRREHIEERMNRPDDQREKDGPQQNKNGNKKKRENREPREPREDIE